MGEVRRLGAVTFVLLTLAVAQVAGASVAAPRAYDWPLSPRPEVVGGFDPPAQRWLPGHRGVDLAASPGDRVLAAGAGIVRFAGGVAGRPVVSIGHPDGLVTTYEPVRPSVSRGAHVARGDVIGTVEAGHPGCRAAACLHWGARRGSGSGARYLNPLALVGALRVRLKPVTAAVTLAGAPAGGRRGAVRH